jgi:hypothetical protein
VTDRVLVRPILALLVALQHLVLRVSFGVHSVLKRDVPLQGYVVGMEEVAGMLTAVASALPGATTVNLARHPFYEYHYDVEFDIGGQRAFLRRVRRLVMAPWVLGRLASRHRTFVYIGGQGFLISLLDGRERELGFLRSHGRTVVCYFTGSEIRSHLLLNKYAESRGIDVITTYQPETSPGIASMAAERQRRLLADAADRHAQLIFNAPVDQMSYLQRPTERCLCFYPDELIRRRPEKWSNLARPLIVHAPSSPLIKGTPLVRAAVRALREEGQEFEYVELIRRPHAEVVELLERAHVVLNEFYAFVPGVFGVEGMAANAVLLTSADPAVEPSLPEGAAEAWVVTPYWRIADQLRMVLDDREHMQEQADRGTAWVAEHCSRSANSATLVAALERLS